MTREEFRNLEQRHWCSKDSAPPATHSPAWLAAIAAGFQAAEAEKLLSNRLDDSLAGRQLVVSAKSHTHFVTKLPRSPQCSFDHAIWSPIERLDARPETLSLVECLALGGGPAGSLSARLRVEGHSFVTTLCCSSCGHSVELLFLSGRLRETSCSRCGASMLPMGFFTHDHLDAGLLSGSLSSRSLSDVGIQLGDIISVSRGGSECHFQVGGAP